MSAELDAATRAHFAARAATYTGGGDASLRAMLELAAPLPGERALDVATGTGLVLFGLAEAVGETGFAAGIDFTPAMLAQAAARRAGGQESPAPVMPHPANPTRMAVPALLAADAARLPFQGESFDIVTCRFSVHHMSDPAASLAAMAGVLRRGGRLVIADFVRPDDPEEGRRHDRLEQLRGHKYVQIYERTQLEQMMASAGCPVQGAQLVQRDTKPNDLWMGPHVAPHDREALVAVVDEITRRGGGGGFEVRRTESEVTFSRSDLVQLGLKMQ